MSKPKKFKLEIDLGNAAFEDCGGNELARILQNLVNVFREEELARYDSAPLKDINGNAVGKWSIK